MVTEFKSIFDLLQAFPTEEACIKHLEDLQWNGNVVSPFDANSKVYKCKGNKYKCKNTGKYFNVKTGTIFEDTKIPLQKWFLALYVFSSHKKGISSHQLARDITVTQKTAWFMLHRLRYAFDHPNFNLPLENSVEIDETYMGGDFKNMHTKAKKEKDLKGRGIANKQPIMGMLERGNRVIAKVVPDTKSKTLINNAASTIVEGSKVYTDENKSYSLLHLWFQHDSVNHGAKQYVNGLAHTNGVENFWSHLKRGIDGIYHWVSVKHLQPYVDEFSLRYNTRQLTTCNRFDLILSNITGRLKYQELISNE